MPTWASPDPHDNENGAGGKLLPSSLVLLLYLLGPVDWLLMLVLIGTELMARIWRGVSPPSPKVFSPPQPECSFVLLSWNSQSMLAESLPALLRALSMQGGHHEVIVVDNHSTDGTDEFICRRFPQVRLLRSEENLYFGAGNRLGIAAATRDVLVLMNSDVIVHPGFLNPLLQAFADCDVFGVASQVSNTDAKCPETGNTHARLTGSEIEWRHDSIGKRSEHPVFWLHRGLFAVDRRKYLWLDGLDKVYDPLYLEDVDLSYRAWKAGWKCLLAVDSQVSHHHTLSTPMAGEGFLQMIVRRNQYLFFWKNISDLPMLAANCLHATGRRVGRARMQGIGVWQEVHSFFGALKRLPAILIRKLSLVRQSVRSDRKIFLITAEESCDPSAPSADAPRTVSYSRTQKA